MSSEPRQPTEEEMRAAYEAELKRLRVEHVLIDNVAALVNLGMRRTGLVPGTEEERDPAQVRLAIESLRALLPVLEQAAPAQIGAIRDAVSQLQLAFVRIGGQPAPGWRSGAGGSGRRERSPGRRARPCRGPRPGGATSARASEARRARAGAAQRPPLGAGSVTRSERGRPPPLSSFFSTGWPAPRDAPCMPPCMPPSRRLARYTRVVPGLRSTTGEALFPFGLAALGRASL